MILLDTDVLIGWLRRDPATVALLERFEADGEDLATTSINAAELLHGAERDTHRSRALAAVQTLLSNLAEVPFGPRGARRFGALMAALHKAGRPVPVLDGIIAALCLDNGGRLATANVKHYAAVHGIEIFSP